MSNGFKGLWSTGCVEAEHDGKAWSKSAHLMMIGEEKTEEGYGDPNIPFKGLSPND